MEFHRPPVDDEPVTKAKPSQFRVDTESILSHFTAARFQTSLSIVVGYHRMVWSL